MIFSKLIRIIALVVLSIFLDFAFLSFYTSADSLGASITETLEEEIEDAFENDASITLFQPSLEKFPVAFWLADENEKINFFLDVLTPPPKQS